MQRSHLILTYLTLLALFLLAPLFWGAGEGRALFLPLYLSSGPLMAAAILFEGLKGGEGLIKTFRDRQSLISPVLLTSLGAALLYALTSFLSLLYEWLVSIPVLGTLFQVALVGVPLVVTLLLLIGALALLCLVYFVAPLVPSRGWEMAALLGGLSERLKGPWLLPFLSALMPLMGSLLLLWLAAPSLEPHLLPAHSPYSSLQWLFLSPLLAALLTYPTAHFFLKATNLERG